MNAVTATGTTNVGSDPDYAEATSMSRISQLMVAWSGPAMIVTFIIGGCILARYLPPQWSPHDSAERVAQIYIDHLMQIRIGLVLSVIAYSMMMVWASATSPRLGGSRASSLR